MDNVDDDTLPQGWIGTCAQHPKALGPIVFDELARDVAIELHNAWPKMDPAVAAVEFLYPGRTLILV